jgi:hypothetical protein
MSGKDDELHITDWKGMHMKNLAPLLAALVLAGCVTAEQKKAADDAQLAGMKAEWDRLTTTVFIPKCESYGLKTGTPEMQRCLIDLTMEEQNRRTARATIRPVVIQQQLPTQQQPVLPQRSSTTYNCETRRGETTCTNAGY